MGCGILFPGISHAREKETKLFKKSAFSYSDHSGHSGNRTNVIVAHVMVAAYESKAVAVRKQTVEKQCDILCNLLIKRELYE